MQRKILHCDLNNFYASVECLERPDLAGVPVVVGGDAESRHGIVLAKNMPAKICGIKTGETLWQARKKCGNLVTLPANFEKYERFSRMAQDIYANYADRIQPFGIDECWIDVSGIRNDIFNIADEIRCRIKEELGVTISVGASFNKVFAKLGSDMKKPDAVTVIDRENFRSTVWPLPIGELLYAGPSTVRGLHAMGISTIGRLAASDETAILKRFGKVGTMLRSYARGEEGEPVSFEGQKREIKSIGNSVTTAKNLETPEEVYMITVILAEKVARRLREADMRAGGVCFSMRDSALNWRECYTKLGSPTACASEIIKTATELFCQNHDFATMPPLRAIGVRAVHLVNISESIQLDFEGREQREVHVSGLEDRIEGLRSKYGKSIVQRAVLLTRPDITKFGKKLENPLPAPRAAT